MTEIWRPKNDPDFGWRIFSRAEGLAEQKRVVDIPKDFKRYYAYKRGDARKRNIPWQISIEECWQLWRPYWNQSRRDQTQGYRGYCLARNGDQGAYSRENCCVKTHSENSRERWQTNRNYKAGKGDQQMQEYVHRVKQVRVGDRVYGSAGEAARQHGIHKTTAHNRCQSSRFPDWQYI